MNRSNSQLSAMAGEFLTLGKLFKREYQASITLGNAKSIDVLVFNPITGRNFNVQVKTLRKKNYFPIRKEDIIPEHIYVFIVLNTFEQEEEYFIIKGETIGHDLNKFFGTSYTREKDSTFPGIYYKPLQAYKNNWEIFDQ